MIIVLQRVDPSFIPEDNQQLYFVKYIDDLPSCSTEAFTLV